MSNRRKWSGLLVVLGLVASVAAPSWGSEVRALRYAYAPDPRGDVPDCRGDITSSSVRYRISESDLFVSVTPACAVPSDTANWPSGSGIEWRIDTTGDGVAEFLLRFVDNGQTTLRNLQTGATVCDPVGQFSVGGDGAASAISVYVDASCIGAPPSIRVAVAAQWAGGPTDAAPDGGGFGPSVMAGAEPPPPPPPPPNPPRQGYWMIGRTGDTYAFGDAGWHGNPSNVPGEIVDIEPTLDGRGYWAIDSLGHLYAFGTAPAFSALPDASESPTQARPGERMTSLSKAVQYGTGVPPRVSGLWGFTSRGRVVHYGFPPSFGDMSGKPLNGEVMDSVATPDGGGYYMVASDGGIFTFGNAEFLGSMGSTPLNAPVQSLVPDPDGRGYWLVASDGGIFTFEADFLGSMGATRLNKPITGMVSFGSGYLMVGTDGGIFTFGDSPFFGSLGGSPPAEPIVAVAVLDDHGGSR